MAGSYAHMTTSKGKLRNNETFCDMIENLGDAYEAAEACYGMIWWLARVVVEQRERGSAGPPTREQIREIIAEAEAGYQAGLRDGGVQRDRR